MIRASGRRHTIVLIIVVTMAACWLAGCAGDEARVLVVGDSLTVSAAGRIEAALEADGLGPANVVAAGGTTFGWAAEQINEHPAPDIVVIAAGTNNTPGGWDEADRADLQAALAAVDGRACVVWIVPTAIRHPAGRASYTDRDARAVVDGIHRALAGTAVHVADWGTVADDRPDLHVDDGVHHTAEGDEAYASFIATATRTACLGTP